MTTTRQQEAASLLEAAKATEVPHATSTTTTENSKLPKLVGHANYFIWARLLKLRLKARNLESVVLSEKALTSADDHQKDALAADLISSALSDTILLAVPEESNARAIWSFLATFYGRVTPDYRRHLIGDFYGSRWTGTMSIEMFLGHLRQVANKLKGANYEVSDDDYIAAIYNAMPPALAPCITALSVGGAVDIGTVESELIRAVETIRPFQSHAYPASTSMPGSSQESGPRRRTKPGLYKCFKCGGGDGHGFRSCTGTPVASWATHWSNPSKTSPA